MNPRTLKRRAIARLLSTRVVTITLHGELAKRFLAMRPQHRAQVIRLALETPIDRLDPERKLT